MSDGAMMAERDRGSGDPSNGIATGSPLISVVTPFYNAADTLARCIESVLAQSCGNFEYILADNRSTDGSGDIARAFAAQDRRIRYMYFAEHFPQLPNYNRALRQISPQAAYCKVVQADDFILPKCLEKMTALAAAHPTIGLVSALRLVNDQIDDIATEVVRDGVMAGQEVCRGTLEDRFFAFGSQTTVMYRADLVRARPEFYNVDSPFADTDVACDLLLSSDFGLCGDVLTCTTRDPKSNFARIAKYDASSLLDYTAMHRLADELYPAQEAADRKRAMRNAYYNRVVRALYERPDRAAYVKFHRSTLKGTVGLDLSPFQLGLGVLRGVAKILSQHVLKHERQAAR